MDVEMLLGKKMGSRHTHEYDYAYKKEAWYANMWLSLPGKCTFYYLLATIAIFIVSPFKYSYINIWITALYSLIAWSLFYCGTRVGIKRKIALYKKMALSEQGKRCIVLMLSIYVIIIFISLLLSYNYSITSLKSSLLNPGESYFDKFMLSNDWQGGNNVFMQVYTITNAVVLLQVPVTMLYWKSLNPLIRALFMIALFVRIMPGLLTGTLVDIGLVVLEIIVSLFALIAIGKTNQTKMRKYLIISIMLIIVFASYSVYAQLGRAKALSWEPWSGEERTYYNTDNMLTPLFGERIAYGINSMLNYVGQGYEGLGQCLQLKFVWTNGIGHSRALMEYAQQYLNWEWIWGKHYLWRNYQVTGRHPLIYWSTAIPWIASDVTFPGALAVLFLIGLSFGWIWKGFLINRDPIRLAIFIRIILLAVFLPANFQVFQGRVMWWGTIGLIAMLPISRLYKRYIQPNSSVIIR